MTTALRVVHAAGGVLPASLAPDPPALAQQQNGIASGPAVGTPAALGRLCAPVSAFDPETVVDLARVLHTCRNNKRHAALAAAAKVTVYADLRPVAVNAEVAALVGLAFCKLFHSALIRALRCGSAGHVGIHLWSVAAVPGVRSHLLIADDGQGSDDELPAKADSGIPTARHCVEQCGGTLTREAGAGTVWRIMLPSQAGTIVEELPASGRSNSFLRV